MANLIEDGPGLPFVKPVVAQGVLVAYPVALNHEEGKGAHCRGSKSEASSWSRMWPLVIGPASCSPGKTEARSIPMARRYDGIGW